MPRFKQQVQADRGLVVYGAMGGDVLARNWPYQSEVVATSGLSLVWDDDNRVWFSFGHDSVNTLVHTSANGKDWVQLSTPIASFVPRVMSAYKVPGGNILLLGGNPAGSSSSKIYYTTNQGATWNVPAGGVGAADTESIEAVGFGPAFRYLALGSASGHIYRATSFSSGWTQVFSAGGSPVVLFGGLVLAQNLATPIALACYAQTTYYSSINGTSWISRTFPAVPSSVTYSTTTKRFYMCTTGGALYTSPNGTSGWSLVPSTAVLTVIKAFGSSLLGVGLANGLTNTSGIIHSSDGGATWAPVLSTIVFSHTLAVAQQVSSEYGTGPNEPIFEPHQALYTTGAPTAIHYASLKGL